MNAKLLAIVVPAIVALAAPLLTWTLGLIGEFGGARRLDYLRNRIDLYEKLMSATQEDAARKLLAHAKEKEIGDVAAYLEGRRTQHGFPNGIRLAGEIVALGAIVMLITNTIGQVFPGAKRGYTGILMSMIAAAVAVYRVRTKSRSLNALFFVALMLLIFLVAYSINGIAASLVNS